MNKIAKIQKEYVELLKSYLDPLGKEAIADHIKAGNRYASLPYLSDVLLAYYESLPEDISDFWEANASDLKKAIAERDSLKLCYSGDISPSNASRLVGKLGLYVDTILIPDPVFNITHQLNQITTRKFYLRSLIRHSLNIVNLQPLLEADLPDPIAAIYPSTLIYDPTFRERARQEALKDTVSYLNQTFNLGLKATDNPFEAMDTFRRPEELVKALADTSTLIPDLTTPSISEGFKDFLEDGKSMYIKRYANQSAGYALCGYIFGRLMSFQDHFANCRLLGGEPIYDSPNSWKMFTWFLNDIFPQGNVLTSEGLVANSIGVNDPKWIGRLSNTKLVEARSNGDLKEIRAILTEGVNRMKYSPSNDLGVVATKVQENLKLAFDDHQKHIGDIEKTLKKKYFLDYPLAIGGSLVGYIPHPIAVAASVPFTLAGWVGLYRDSKKIKASKTKGRIIGIMYDAEK